MKQHPVFICISICLFLLLAGCGSARRGEPHTAPLEIDTYSLALGQALFMRNCHPCHPGGEAGVGPALNNKPLPGFLIRLQVRRGLGAMPSFSEEQISDRELDELVRYMQSLRELE